MIYLILIAFLTITTIIYVCSNNKLHCPTCKYKENFSAMEKENKSLKEENARMKKVGDDSSINLALMLTNWFKENVTVSTASDKLTVAILFDVNPLDTDAVDARLKELAKMTEATDFRIYSLFIKNVDLGHIYVGKYFAVIVTFEHMSVHNLDDTDEDENILNTLIYKNIVLYISGNGSWNLHGGINVEYNLREARNNVFKALVGNVNYNNLTADLMFSTLATEAGGLFEPETSGAVDGHTDEIKYDKIDAEVVEGEPCELTITEGNGAVINTVVNLAKTMMVKLIVNFKNDEGDASIFENDNKKLKPVYDNSHLKSIIVNEKMSNLIFNMEYDRDIDGVAECNKFISKSATCNSKCVLTADVDSKELNIPVKINLVWTNINKTLTITPELLSLIKDDTRTTVE